MLPQTGSPWFELVAGYFYQHMDMIRAHASFRYLTFPLFSQFVEYFPQIPGRFSIKLFSPMLRYPHTAILHV
jgi:hypothetical protein